MDVTIAIPTYERGEILIDTVHMLLSQDPPAAEIILADQTASHPPAADQQLRQWHDDGVVRWLRLPRPSIPHAMNQALLAARSPVVLFLDDDIVPAQGLVVAHARNYRDESIWAVTGQILQPGQKTSPEPARSRGRGIWKDLNFPFNSTGRCEIFTAMAGNLSVRREKAIEAGGFDENFVGVSYRFETEFARRLARKGGKVMYDSAASIRHLQAPRGGTRVHGIHLRSSSPVHSVGDYYFAFREPGNTRRSRYMAKRMLVSIKTRYHLLHPWFVPVTLCGEIRGYRWAARLRRQEPRLISHDWRCNRSGICTAAFRDSPQGRQPQSTR